MESCISKILSTFIHIQFERILKKSFDQSFVAFLLNYFRLWQTLPKVSVPLIFLFFTYDLFNFIISNLLSADMLRHVYHFKKVCFYKSTFTHGFSFSAFHPQEGIWRNSEGEGATGGAEVEDHRRTMWRTRGPWMGNGRYLWLTYTVILLINLLFNIFYEFMSSEYF